jgi:VWFA-related protein
MHLFPRFFGLLVGGLLISSSAPGQAPGAQAAPANAAAQATSGETGAILHANVNLVLVDVVVTERGNAVHGLERSRFHVFEDGHEEKITAFDEVIPNGAPSASAAAAQAALLPHTYSNLPVYPAATAANVLLLDALNTPMENQAEMREQALAYLGGMTPGTAMAIFTLSTHLQMIRGFSTDTAELASAVEKGKSGAGQSALMNPTDPQSLNPTANELALTGNAIAQVKQQLANEAAFQTDQRVNMTLDAMKQLSRYLSGIPGRKNVIWFSGSFPIALDPNDQLTEPMRNLRSYTDEVREANELLASARVAVYPVDARGVMTQTSASASYKPRPNVASGRVNLPAPAQDDVALQRQTESEHASMQRIADATGGKAFLHTNDLKGAMQNALENGSSYYTVGYVPPKGPDGQFRKIQVRLDGARYDLAYRRGYVAVAKKQGGNENREDSNALNGATQHGAPQATQVLFQARVLDATDPLLKGIHLPEGPAGEMATTLKGPVHRYIAELTVDAHTLSFTELPDGQHQANLKFGMVAFDVEGKRTNFLGKSITVKLPQEQFEQVIAHGVRVRMALDMPAGDGFVRIAVEDVDADRVGSLEVRVADTK